MDLDKDYYRMTDVALMLGITKHKLWRLRLALDFPIKRKGTDKREKWVSAETVQMLHDYLNNPK